MLRFQQVQSEHGDRLSRLERRHDDDARLKSVWGTSSPFPSVLGGTPQQVPLQHPPNEPFSTFDDDQNNLLGSLHLDANDEPRRIGATSRANSVRFDESANQGWAHASRSSIDLIPRTGSGLGGHAMSERTYSHKSDGRQSSTGHSVHSATSGRANSLGLDTSYGNQNTVSPLETPGLAPGLFILGPVPAIIRCWLTTNFKHDSLLYAAVCTGSYTSFLDSRLIHSLGFQDHVEVNDEGVSKVRLAVYLPEAIQYPVSSRLASPAPQIPSFTVTFTLVSSPEPETDSKAIQIFLGSDVLRAHNADVLFSSNTMTMFDDERSKLSIPLVRPENEQAFNTLGVSSGFTASASSKNTTIGPSADSLRNLTDRTPGKQLLAMEADRDLTGGSSDEGLATTPESSRHSLEQRPIPGLLSTKTESLKETSDGSLPSTTVSRASPAIWRDWRRGEEKPTATPSMDWAGASKGTASASYQRRETGIKVLKPVKTSSRIASGPSIQSGSPSLGQSRFFDDGKRRTSMTSSGEGSDIQSKRPAASEIRSTSTTMPTKENTSSGTKARTTNPIGDGAQAVLCDHGVCPDAIQTSISFQPPTYNPEEIHRHYSHIYFRASAKGRELQNPQRRLVQLSSIFIRVPTEPIWNARSPRLYAWLARPSCGSLHACFHSSACLWSFTAPGRRLLFTTASSQKKRKLVRPAETGNIQGDSSSPLLQEGSGLASPRSSPTLTANSNRRTSTSPPRYLPPHLHDEVREASKNARTSPDSGHSASLSPSEAYAGLTLDTEESSKDKTRYPIREIVPIVSDNPRKASLRGYEPSQDLQESGRTLPRASSPAKRPFSAMDPSAGPSARDGMDVDEANNRQPEPVSAAGSPDPPATSTEPYIEQARATSVDMLDGSNPQTATSYDSTSSPAPHSSTSATSFNGDSPPKVSSGDSEMSDQKPLPSFDEQVEEIRALAMQPVQEKAVGFAVARAWLERPMSRASAPSKDENYSKEAREGDVGPIDNSSITLAGDFEDLVDEMGERYVPLKPDVTMSQEYEILPKEAWDKLVDWYGIKDNLPPIRRYVHDTTPEGSHQQNLQYELSPPIFIIRKLRNDQYGTTTAALKDSNAKAPRLLASHDANFQKVLSQAKKLAGIELKTKVKVWRIIENLPTAEESHGRSGMLTPATSRSGSPAPQAPAQQSHDLIIDLLSFTNMTEGSQREMLDIKDETANPKYNGHSTLSTVGLGASQVLVLEEQIGGPAGGEFVSDNVKSTAAKHGVSLTAKNSNGRNAAKALTASRNASPAPSGTMTRGRTRRDGKTRGTVGLSNLGNTCYMNSALQCIRSIEELSLYFLQGQYKQEINPDNPLGHAGQLAKSGSTFTPRDFKHTLGRLSGTFSGYQQQDSQEFLSFLVDGLHEDLNRIKKKPYIENPDSDDKTHTDARLIRELGEKFREGHHARNDSVAMDLFSGFYKNTMVCPHCDKVSITFDPYSLLTLQLPIEQTWQHTVVFAPLHDKPIYVEVDMDKNASIRGLKEYIAKRFPGVNAKRLMCVETYSNKIYKTFDDREAVSDCGIQDRDEIVIYELDSQPTNYPPPKKKAKKFSYGSLIDKSEEEDTPKSESPLANRMLVPVFHRASSAKGYNNRSFQLWPFFVVITREEAANYDEIHRKVLAKVATMTTNPILSDENLGYGSNNSSDAVLTTEEDASSTTDPTVKADSVEGEGSIVDVTMTESSAEQVRSQDEDSHLPRVLTPGEFIPPELQRLFTLRFAKANGKEMIQTGFSSLQGGDDYPAVSTRIPSSRDSRRSSIQSQGTGSASSASSISEETETQQSTPPQLSFNSRSADSDSDLPSVDSFTRVGKPHKFSNGNRGKRRGKRGAKTYSKKDGTKKEGGRWAHRPLLRQGSEISDLPSDPESPPRLIRLGEALILDWDSEAYEALFGATNDADDMRGRSTWEEKLAFDDPDLTHKRATRSKRKKHGVTLDECFQETAKSEILSEENAWYCNRCKELRRAEKTLAIWTTPDILVLHLKRFSSNRAFRDKIDVLVDFPIEGLDISKWVGLPEDKNCVYDLFAVDNHYGGLGGGHYTAYAQNFYDKRWYEYNDSSVSSRQPESCISTAAYLLFYRRRSDKPLGPPYLQNLVQEAWNPIQAAEESNATDNGSENSTSAADTSSGNGLRARDSSRSGANGLSSALVVAGAAHDSAPGATTSHSDDELLPTYGEEGFEDSIRVRQSAAYERLEYTQPSGWSFDSLGHKSDDAAKDDDDDNSMLLTGPRSDNGADDLQSRMLEDFDDDNVNLLNSGAGGQVTPDMSADERSPTLVGASPSHDEDVVESMEFDGAANAADDDDNEEVVEVHVDNGDVNID
ncbi:UCH-domain-containing protein [Pseudovirgaria hyperparasitica]|uniref:ubiquitinyl hydrolase 1 n=1 Tax=Pseudovirgaria hyperparasitica TaxID=470096 RepID=A0A6A6WMB7_9PEZI|nr:UCH-domain-containing protein [Pseudovirgaria hyperparasitica]KAF2763298.1 UCH-domain-containing protein [Pseudovirgaria hyperparasitica]